MTLTFITDSILLVLGVSQLDHTSH